MTKHIYISDRELLTQIRQKEIVFGGNHQLKIYGTLKCRSGRRMKKENRVFFKTAGEAIEKGYRPCGHCMKNEYRTWILFRSGLTDQAS
jgi:methylphosphotriester-DNA--protein-cysteine methyltransferase